MFIMVVLPQPDSPRIRQHFLLFAQVDQQSLFLDRDGGKGGHALADLELIGVIQAAVLLVDNLQAADHLVQVVQRHTDHRLGHKAVVVKDGPVKARVADGVLHHDGFARLGNHAFKPQTVFHGDIGDIHRTDMEQRTQPVGLGIQKPDRPRLAVQGFDNDLQTPGQRILEVVHLQKLLHDLPCRFGKSLLLRHALQLLAAFFRSDTFFTNSFLY